MKQDLKAFTVRLPPTLVEQIDVRARLAHRTRNAEVIVLLENAIDGAVARDLEVIRQTADRS